MSDNTNNGFPVPEEPLTREEKYLSAIAGVTPSTEIPEKPLTRVEAYLNRIVENGGGGGGGGFTPTDAQLDAMNSGITEEDVEQISTNKNNISSLLLDGSGKTGDLNDIAVNEFAVYTNQATNLPSNNWFYVRTSVDSVHPSSRRLQEAFNMSTGVSYIRTMIGGEWDNWLQITNA